ncbi:PREDICTED: F-box protein At3g57590-like [Camelina sativa]|uniref:F-box protein At3g57590-like n=1 Tax=Camelina sativa TaxID=90675 RepID=A0ABM0X505_CAMSA|nr:PREDICTED: F-box protein At3g57590-like [Camelina sativa]
MNSEKTLDAIPIDLFHEIFSRLPSKSVGRCRCVSKQWASILGHQDFTRLFLTRSSTRPRILFAHEQYNGEWLFYSSPHPPNTYEKSIVVSVDFHTKCHIGGIYCRCSYASGLVYISDVRVSKNKDEPVICNPLTGQYVILPKLRANSQASSFFGFDPVDKQYKVLLMNGMVNNKTAYHILTLGTGIMRWREIQCPFTHQPFAKGICINGVLYYLAEPTDNSSTVIVCFDVRSEKFKFIKSEYFDQLINYKGKLGGTKLEYETGSRWGTRDNYSGWRTRELPVTINGVLYYCLARPIGESSDVIVCFDVRSEKFKYTRAPSFDQLINYKGKLGGIIMKYEYDNNYYKWRTRELCMCVLEDIEKQEWSICVFPFPDDRFCNHFSVVGVTPTGEIVLWETFSKSYVIYFSPVRNTFQYFNFQGRAANCGKVHAFVDHIEDVSVNDVKQLKSSI